MPSSISVVVPTKNRLQQAAGLVRQLLAQTVVMDELIMIDQSDGDEGRTAVTQLVADAPEGRRPRLHYVLDRTIDGAAAARNAGLDLASGDVVMSIDDDMTLEPDLLETLRGHYDRAPWIDALCAIITNYDAPPRRQRLLTALFCRGPFRDERQPLYWSWRRWASRPTLIPIRMLNGGCMSFRRTSLGEARFDRRYRGSSCGEDVDISWTLAARGARIVLATDARVAHARGARPSARYEETMLTSWGFLYAKHVPKTLRNRLAFGWFVVGVVFAAAVASLRQRTLDPLRSAGAGVFALTHGFVNCAFLKPASLATAGAERTRPRAA